jgi:hypothetical protein
MAAYADVFELVPRLQLAGLKDVSGPGVIRVGNRRHVRCGDRYSVSPGK